MFNNLNTRIPRVLTFLIKSFIGKSIYNVSLITFTEYEGTSYKYYSKQGFAPEKL